MSCRNDLDNAPDRWLVRWLVLSGAIAGGSRLGALAVVVVGALVWGVYWVPIRFLEQQGLPGIWSGFALTSGAFLFALVIYIGCGARRPDATQIAAACLVGVAFALYGAALAYTDVVRAILLFYLTPIWSMLIDCLFLGRRWRMKSTLAVIVALAGIVFIFRGELPLEGLGAVGDWMSLAAGMAWSVASTLLFSRGAIHPLSLSTWAIGASALVSGLVLLVLGESAASILSNTSLDVWSVSGLSLVIGGAYVVPVMLVTLWGTTQFSAVTMGFLLTGEIVSGVATSAIFLGERFGWPELAGTVLIIIGACIEVLRNDAVPGPDRSS